MTMAACYSTTRPSSFTFPNLSTSSHQPPPQRLLLHQSALTTTTLNHRPKTFTPIRSIDVSKEDKQEELPPAPTDPQPEPELELGLELESERKINPRRLEEKFAVVNTGIYECRSCGYRYDQAAGDPSYPIPPGLPFDRLPDDWRCPTCGASQSFFQSKSMEIAGFAQNQQFGFGGNALTSGQKALLIYGGLLLGFALFLSGYFLQ